MEDNQPNIWVMIILITLILIGMIWVSKGTHITYKSKGYYEIYP